MLKFLKCKKTGTVYLDYFSLCDVCGTLEYATTLFCSKPLQDYTPETYMMFENITIKNYEGLRTLLLNSTEAENLCKELEYPYMGNIKKIMDFLALGFYLDSTIKVCNRDLSLYFNTNDNAPYLDSEELSHLFGVLFPTNNIPQNLIKVTEAIKYLPLDSFWRNKEAISTICQLERYIKCYPH